MGEARFFPHQTLSPLTRGRKAYGIFAPLQNMLKVVAVALFVLCFFARSAESDSGATCYVKTKGNKCCVFPFVYKSTKYYNCKDNRWCSTTPDYYADGDWDWCTGMEMYLTADDQAWVYANGKYIANDNGKYDKAQKYILPQGTTLLAVYVKNTGGLTGLAAKLSNGVVSDSKWKCTTQFQTNWEKLGAFNDLRWPKAVVYRSASGVAGLGSDIRWIGPQNRYANAFYCRRKISFLPERPAIEGEGTCDKPLGMQSGWITASDIKTSSVYSRKHDGSRGRLHIWKQGSFSGAWSSYQRNTHQWLQVDFGRQTIVTGVATQGRQDFDQWLETYHLSYGPQENRIFQYKVHGKLKVFNGNKDRNTVVRNKVDPPIVSRLIRINPMKYHGHTSVRVEFYGCTKTCKVDVGVLMDESGSVKREDFEREKNFVNNIAGHFRIGRDAAQFGVISYSTGAKLDIKLNQFSDLPLLQYAVSTINSQGGWTYTDRALRLAKSHLFSAANGARTGVAKVLIVITDGRSTPGINSLRGPVRVLKDSSVNIYAVGVGSKIGKTELELMASDKKHVYYVKNMAELQNIVEAITKQSCTDYNCPYVKCHYGPWSSFTATCGQNIRRTKSLVTTTQATVSQQGGCSGLPQSCNQKVTETINRDCPCQAVRCSWGLWASWSATCGRIFRQRQSIATNYIVNKPNNCNGIQTTCPAPETQTIFVSCCKADIGFALDDSGSLSQKDFEEEKDFAAQLANGFSNFGMNGIQMSALRYSYNAQLSVPFSKHRDKYGFMRAVKSIQKQGGRTNTDLALLLAKNEMFAAKYGARTGVTKVLLVITDGASSGGLNSIKRPVKLLKDSGVNIFSIGVGNNINRRELNYMASEPVNSHVYFVKNMKGLSVILHQLATSSCQEFICKYVTCNYSQWSDWSKSCGAGITRVKKLTKTNWHTIKKQGGCSGLNTTCLPSISQTKVVLCSCKYVTCAWEKWSDWSATCGSATRTRKSKATEHVVQQLNCNGLQTTCPAPEKERRTTNCPCRGVRCIWQPWAEWSATCGFRRRTRSIKAEPTIVHQPSCAGVPTTCSQKPQVQEKTSPLCKCYTVRCQWNAWSVWSGTCGDVTRTRTMKTLHIIVESPNCKEYPSKCPSRPEVERRQIMCTCPTVTCSWNPWSDWSASCGKATRHRTIKETHTNVQKLNCDGLPQRCTEKPQTDHRETMCTCSTVRCTWNKWSDWSATCGKASRQRRIKEEHVTVQQASCDGLPQRCAEQPETEHRETMCTCPTVKCTWNNWGKWSATCGKATRQRTIKTEHTTVQQASCDGLPQRCTQAPQKDHRETMCTCPTVRCTWNNWGQWSATCGKATRQRTIKEEHTTVQEASCDGLPQRCTQAPQTDHRETMCTCPTVRCTWNNWSAWSATCGKASRQRTIKTEHTTVQQASCDGLPQRCTQTPQTDHRETMCTCPTVRCTWNNWGAWSASCGKATRQRTINEEHTTVQQASCDGLPQRCTQAPETEHRETMCTCPTVRCTWNNWGQWSATCGKATRQRTINEEHTTVQQASCAGLPQRCTQAPETEHRETMCTCPTVRCTWNNWGAWSATCGKATRQRTIKTEHTTVQQASCAGLPQRCTQAPQKDHRETICTCPTVRCTWNNWGQWSATCGKATRQRAIKEEHTTVQQASCDGLPQRCTQAPQTDHRETMCTCPTVRCTWNNWSAWSATCGKATRQRTINEEHTTVQQASCDGLPQRCSQAPQTDHRETMCTCPTVRCTWNNWGQWSATCGKATRQRTIKTEPTTVQQISCDGLPQTCTQSPETDARVTKCPCPTVNCTLGPWGNWSGECGKVFRQKEVVETKIMVQKESCDGLPQKCNLTPVKEEKQLKECELCFTVSCKYSPWSKWSASCGPATRIRSLITEEIELELPSCDGLPLECHNQSDETQTRNIPCPPTTSLPTLPPTTGA